MTTFIRYFERIGRLKDCKLHNFNKTALAVNNTHRTNPASDPHLYTLRHINHFCSADYHPNVWSNSRSGIGTACAPASATNLSCSASTAKFAVKSNSSSGIASSFSGAISCCPFTATGGERAGAIAGALAGSPTCSSICRTVAGSVMNPTTRTRPPHPLLLSGANPRSLDVENTPRHGQWLPKSL